MSEQINFRSIEQRTIQLMNYEDGLWDLLIGITFLMFSTYPLTRAWLGPEWNLALVLSVLFLLVGIQVVARRIITGPRLGYARARRTPARKVTFLVTLMLVLITFALVLLTLIGPGWIPSIHWKGAPEWLRYYTVDILVLLFFVGLFSLLAHRFGVPRLYLYGWLIGIGNLASVIMERHTSILFLIPLAVAAGIIIAIGIAIFVRFIQQHPVATEEH